MEPRQRLPHAPEQTAQRQPGTNFQPGKQGRRRESIDFDDQQSSETGIVHSPADRKYHGGLRRVLPVKNKPEPVSLEPEERLRHSIGPENQGTEMTPRSTSLVLCLSWRKRVSKRHSGPKYPTRRRPNRQSGITTRQLPA